MPLQYDFIIHLNYICFYLFQFQSFCPILVDFILFFFSMYNVNMAEKTT